ncbi:MAG: hypothetical protein SFV15_16800 [Polyangiaceae bacterium]|nr:hypothetical protein [Polyangiaceae bacterium]
MATLEWDFRVTNAAVVERALAGIERRVVVHNQRVAKTLGQGARTPSAGAASTSAAAGVDKLALARIRAEGKVAAIVARAQATRERMELQTIQRTERQAISSAKRIAAAQEREAKRAAKAAQASQVRTGRAIGRSVTNSIGGVGRLAGAALGIGGGFAVAGAIENQMSEEARASKLANQAQVPGEKKQILADARGVRGFTGSQALEGMSAFVTKTGDLKTARELIGSLGDLALATDTDLGDLGATAGQVFNVLKGQIKDPAERMKQLKDIMGTLAQQGSMGAVEMNNLATIFGKLGSATSRFEGGAPALMKQMGALAQLAVAGGGASSPEEAATAVARLSTDIVTNRKKFAALPGGGVTVQSATDPSKLRDASAIMIDVLEKTKGDITQVSGLFGGESIKVFEGLAKLYKDAEGVKKGTGIDALKAGLGELTGASTSAESIKARTDSRMGDADMQFQEAMKKFNIEVGTHLLPAIQKMIPKFVELIPVVTKLSEGAANLAEYLLQNPLRGVMLAMTASVAKDVAAASLGKVLSESLSTQLGKAGGVIAVAAGAFTVGSAIIDLGFDAISTASKNNIRQSAENFNTMTGARGELARGGLSDARKKELQAIIAQGDAAAGSAPRDRQEFLSTFLKGMTGNTITGGLTGGGVTGGVASVIQQAIGGFVTGGGPSVTGAITQSEREAGRAEQIRAATEANALLKQAVTSLEKISGNTSATAPNRGNKPSPVKP